MNAIRSLILLAADNEIRLLENAGEGTGLTELRHLTKADFPDVDVEFTDKPPRVMHGAVSHTAEPRHTEAELERQRMVKHTIATLQAAWNAGAYDRLFISAPDKVLALLRKGMPTALKDKVTADLDKDIVKVALRDLPAHFAKVAAF